MLPFFVFIIVCMISPGELKSIDELETELEYLKAKMVDMESLVMDMKSKNDNLERRLTTKMRNMMANFIEKMERRLDSPENKVDPDKMNEQTMVNENSKNSTDDWLDYLEVESKMNFAGKTLEDKEEGMIDSSKLNEITMVNEKSKNSTDKRLNYLEVVSKMNSAGETLEDEKEGIVIKKEPENQQKENKCATFKALDEQKIKDEENKPINIEKLANHGKGTKANAKTNGLPSGKKNYASPDCGAKVVGAAPGSKGSGNVITSNWDDYIINKCSEKTWFIVELCNYIQVVKIEIANIELYSSSPKDFKVYLAKNVPRRESDWVEIGHFNYRVDPYGSSPRLQSFRSEVSFIGKFVKVEILSNQGTEFFCPISVFKVYGVSEKELLSFDNTHEDNEDDDDEDAEALIAKKRRKILLDNLNYAVDTVVNVFTSRDRENHGAISSSVTEE